MSSSCTLFAIAPAEVEETPEQSLPGYDHHSAITNVDRKSTLELGSKWRDLHTSLGGHAHGHPLGFLAGGGAELAAFSGYGTTGRYFPPSDVVLILAHLAAIAGPAREAERMRVFVANIVTSGRGLVVYQFG